MQSFSNALSIILILASFCDGLITSFLHTTESLLQSAPSISELNDFVGAKMPSKWELFGVQVGLEKCYLDCLCDEYHDSETRFIRIFNEWKDMKTSDFTWGTVIKVLKSNTISEYSLAERVLKYLENSSEGGECTTAEKMKCETLIPPDNPLSSNSGVSLMVQKHGRTGQLEIIVNSR